MDNNLLDQLWCPLNDNSCEKCKNLSNERKDNILSVSTKNVVLDISAPFSLCAHFDIDLRCDAKCWLKLSLHSIVKQAFLIQYLALLL